MSETGFSLLKVDDGEKLRSRSWHGQFRELTCKCIVHNLSQAASLTRRLLSFSGVSASDIAVATEMSSKIALIWPFTDPTPPLSCVQQGTSKRSLCLSHRFQLSGVTVCHLLQPLLQF
jgi:hypothetical protein